MSAIPELPSKRIPYGTALVRLGKSGLKVSKIILGCMTYSSYEGWAGQNWWVPEEEAIKHIKYAYDAGIQTFDTANVYSNGQSEEILGRAIKKLNLPREEIVVMTKFTAYVNENAKDVVINPEEAETEIRCVNQYGNSRKHIFDAVQASLKRLQLDYIDVLQVHRLKDGSNIEEMMEALHDVVKAGWVRYIGMSSCYAWQYYAINNRLTPFISMQDHHNLIYREEEREMFPTLKHFGVASIPWSPLGRGLLCRPFSEQKATARGQNDRFSGMYQQNPALKAIIDRRVDEELSKKKGVSMAQISVAWSLSKDVVAAPIVGTTSLANLKDIIEGAHLQLTEEEIKYLEEPYVPVKVIRH
ncbi:hypothetical protein POSPLADRAFT_1045746 [Postia placenta MAD-698-R-SB12]|uniref:NADP-dependent oxidoreductase domain-containing protein n=1 Tax=Postia placenta MAD-698-R-SB12 TaxID=670580 RepID=A0A1X6N473_9APHY|nr:hypothetical protein POSPLADRAFT_1045746 [Postia placenta MAD-698-R-SB12]OSX63417.1 hypothetical protein POSPLADRAFT_1045746 [Postia placenta MAD-698-R-SB12]